MRVVDLVDVGGAQRAFASERFVDVLIERGVVAGGVGVPDFVIARVRRLAQRLDLAEGDLRERQRALVFVTVDGHLKRPRRSPTARTLLPTPQFTLTESHEREVNNTYTVGVRASAANPKFAPSLPRVRLRTSGLKRH